MGKAPTEGPPLELSEDEENLLVLLDKLESQGVGAALSIKEALLQGEPYLRMSVTYSIRTSESDEVGDYADHGHEIEDELADLTDVQYEDRKHGFRALSRDERSSWWDSNPEENYHTGETTEYSLHLRTPDNKELPAEVFDLVNVLFGGRVGDTLPTRRAARRNSLKVMLKR